MKTSTELTKREAEVVKQLIRCCLDNMGGKEPTHLKVDPHTWVEPSDLLNYGHTINQARGFFSSLETKDFICHSDVNEWYMMDEAVDWAIANW